MTATLLDRSAPVIQVRRLTAWPTAVVRRTVRSDRVAGWVPHAHVLVRETLAAQGIPVAGPPFARFVDDGPTVEAGFPVRTPIEDLGEVSASGLPAGVALVATDRGTGGDLDAAYEALDAWLAEHGYADSGPHWEVYLADRTEVVVPYQES
jgi:effector-binding domain-containing protein